MKGENEKGKGKEKMTLTAPACKALINLTKPSIVPESHLEICTAKLLAQITQSVYLSSELNFKNKNKLTKSNQQKKKTESEWQTWHFVSAFLTVKFHANFEADLEPPPSVSLAILKHLSRVSAGSGFWRCWWNWL